MPDSLPPHNVRPWPVIRNALTTFLDMQRPHMVQGIFEADVTDALSAIHRLERQLRLPVSFHAFVLHCVCRAAVEVPEVLSFRHGNRIVTFEDVDILTPVDKKLPSGVRIPVAYVLRGAQKKTLARINWELRQAVKAPDLDNDRSIRMRRRLAKLPWFIRRFLAWRMRKDAFWMKKLHGNIGVTSLRVHGFSNAAFGLPLAMHSIDWSIGNITDRPKIDAAGQLVNRKMLCLAGAADHDLLDGVAIARYTHALTRLLETAAGLDENLIAESRELMRLAKDASRAAEPHS